MHCASCEILIEKKLLEIEGVESAEASTAKGEATVEYRGEKPKTERLNHIFKKENYVFYDKPFEASKSPVRETIIAFNVAVALMAGFLLLNRLFSGAFLNIGQKSSLLAFLGLGVFAGFSTCAALTGGIVLSMSKKWQEIYSSGAGYFQKIQPHLLFNAGRILSYGLFGGILGLIGKKLQISLAFSSFLVIAVSLAMFILGLQMLEVKFLRRFQFSLPKFAVRKIADEKNFHGKYMPFLMGGATFFLPCGFTLTAQGLALLSGSFLWGAASLGVFALGTAPSLLFIGLSSAKFFSEPRFAERFAKTAGFMVLFFALFNINSQMNVLGYQSLSNAFSFNRNDADFPRVVDGKQVVKMAASSRGYEPNYIKVKAGVPVRWEITDKGTSGCTNAIIASNLFAGAVSLTPGQVSVKEFTPKKAGKYKFSCWMGMVTGTIEAVN